jgi:hypothetical protein
MFRLLMVRSRGRHAVSTIIGGLIVLSLLLTAVGTMVFVSQQYDQYQQTVKKIGQYDSQQSSENLVVNSPGLAILTSTSIPGWGSGCTTTYNCYNMSISNLGGVGVQIVRLYINSTGPAGSGCSSPNPQPCIINPSSAITSYAFNQAEAFMNPGETNHVLVFALPLTPTAVTLPDPNPAVPENSIVIVTGRGNVFSSQWPMQLQIFGQSQSAFSAGILKVAYQSISGGYNSANEPGLGGSGGSGYCHEEPLQKYPAASNYAEELTGLSGLQSGTTLYFVDPWITDSILTSAYDGDTQLYIYVLIINTGTAAYTPSSGSLDLTWYSADHLTGTLLGIYYNGVFYTAANAPSITSLSYYYAIYVVNTIKLDHPPPQGGISSVMFWGDASVTDGTGSNAEGATYYSGDVLLPGLWIRSSC